MIPSITLATEEKTLKDSIEWDRNFEELKVLRELAMRSVPKQTTNVNSSSGRSLLNRWFPQWMGWYSSTTENCGQGNMETAQLEGEILKALSDSADNNTLLKRDAVFGQFFFTLKSGTLSLCTLQETSKESVPMIELQFKNLCLNIVNKPRTSSHLFELSLGAMYLRDKFTLNSLFPVLIGPPGHDRLSAVNRSRGPSPKVNLTTKADELSDQLFYLAYEINPDNSVCDTR